MNALAVPAQPTLRGQTLVDRTYRFEAMGGSVLLRVTVPAGAEEAADRDLRLAARRIERWASRITRFDQRSELSALNRDAGEATSMVGPTILDLLMRAQAVGELTNGLVDVTLLGSRLAAEHGGTFETAGSRWWLDRARRRGRVRREGQVEFDPDGVGKGWIADRALALLERYPAAMVDADGDVALRCGQGTDWAVAIADPRRAGEDLAVLAAPQGMARTVGIATSGTTVHRWEHTTGWAHHLIDPRTSAPAETDLVQATVVASDALTAEALAKAAVIAGSEDGLRLLAGAGAAAAVLLLRSGECIALSGSEGWLR